MAHKRKYSVIVHFRVYRDLTTCCWSLNIEGSSFLLSHPTPHAVRRQRGQLGRARVEGPSRGQGAHARPGRRARRVRGARGGQKRARQGLEVGGGRSRGGPGGARAGQWRPGEARGGQGGPGRPGRARAGKTPKTVILAKSP